MTTDKAMVTDAMVEAATSAILDRVPQGYGMRRTEARAYAEAAISAALTLERGEAEPVAAMVVDHTGCEHMSRDITQIERIADDCGERPTYLYSILSKRGEAEETPAKKQSDAILELLDHPAPVAHVAGGTPTAWTPLIQALSRMFDNRQADGGSLISPEDRRTIIDGCHDLMAARHSPAPQTTERASVSTPSPEGRL